MDRSRIFSIVKKYILFKVPGYFECIDLFCRKLFGKSCVDLLIDEPEKFREVLVNMYSGDTNSAYFIVKHLFLRPILIELNKLDTEEELATLLLQNTQRFRERLKQILEI